MSKNPLGDTFKIQIHNEPIKGSCLLPDPILFYVMEGQLQISFDDYETCLEREGIFVINPNKKYRTVVSGKTLYATTTIPSQILSNLSKSMNILFWCDSGKRDDEHCQRLRVLLEKLLTRVITVRENGEDFGYLALCYQLMDELTSNFLLKASDRDNYKEETDYEERIFKINHFIQMNYSNPISSKNLSEELFLSQGYLSRFFKKYYGMSFADFLQRVRLDHAVEDLIYTSLPITRITYDNGFANVSAFNKAFKEVYGGTPSAMRKKMREETTDLLKNEENKEVTDQLISYLKNREEIAPEDGNLINQQDACSVSFSRDINPVWSDTINVGPASILLHSEMREQLIFLSQKCNLRYIRFWNIFSPELMLDLAEKHNSYNFSKLDSILDFLVAISLKPHLELGMKPKRLFRTIQDAIVMEKTEEIHDLDILSHFMQALMLHLLRRYGKEELDTWRIEYWFNETLWGEEEEEDRFFERFSCIYQIVKRFSVSLEVGGCGLRGDWNDLEYTGLRFLRKWKQQICKPDFISTLVYAYERGEIDEDIYSKRSTDSDNLAYSIERIRNIMRKADFSDCKLYVTEWNLTISDRNFINDSCFKGAYILKNIIDNYEKVDTLSYFLASDLVAEHYDSDELLFGGCGLISKAGILKPSGYALRFLKWLYPYFVGKGSNYLLTTDQHYSYGLVCHNMKKLNYNYYLTMEDEIDKDEIWKYFEDRDPLNLTLSLTDVMNGSYQIKTYVMNEEVGSQIKYWSEMGYEKELTRNDVRYLKRVCGPRLSIQTVEVDSEILTLNINMDYNEIRFIRIRRIN